MAKRNRWRDIAAQGPDYVILLILAGLLLIGLMMVYSSTFALAYELYDNPTYFLVRQATWAGLGVLAMLIVTRIDYHRWRYLSVPALGLTLLLLTLVLFIGEEVHGSRRWLLSHSLQPSEFTKLAMVLYIAHWLSSKGEKIQQVSYGLVPFAVLIGLVTAFIILEPDFGTAILIVATTVAMFFIAGADLLQLGIGFLVGGATLYLLISQTSYAASRISTYLADPLNDPFSLANYHVSQTLIALGSGGITGVGLGASRQKLGFLPASHTDTIFAILGEELGLFGCLVVMVLLAILAYRGLRIAFQAPDIYGMLLASGITCWLTIQALVNIAVVTATLPFTGLPLPFISFGGSSLVISLVGVGILLNISQGGEGEEGATFDFGWRHRRPHLSRRGRG